MEDQELLRYSRHILLDAIGIEGQKKIGAAHVLIIGAGGLGSACAPYLAASGVGKLTIIDDDVVDLTNLQRQIMHDTPQIGQPKALSAQTMLNRLNPHVQIISVHQRADPTLLDQLIPNATIVVDCADNFRTRQTINSACVKHRTPLIFGAAIQFDGQFSVFDSRRADSPCYACLFSPTESFEEAHCSSMGVFSPLVGIIGSIQAAQALQVITESGTPMIGKLGIWDALHTQMHQIKLPRNPHCVVCQDRLPI
jgi:molybdopterin/thiamine biosynthesis adenylyltransferase